MDPARLSTCGGDFHQSDPPSFRSKKGGVIGRAVTDSVPTKTG